MAGSHLAGTSNNVIYLDRLDIHLGSYDHSYPPRMVFSVSTFINLGLGCLDAPAYTKIWDCKR